MLRILERCGHVVAEIRKGGVESISGALGGRPGPVAADGIDVCLCAADRVKIGHSAEWLELADAGQDGQHDDERSSSSLARLGVGEVAKQGDSHVAGVESGDVGAIAHAWNATGWAVTPEHGNRIRARPSSLVDSAVLTDQQV